MNYLHNATKKWINVPDMIMNYEDEDFENYGSAKNNNYNIIVDDEDSTISIITNKDTKITTIKSESTTNTASIGDNKEPLKARLPKLNEIYGYDDSHCTGAEGTCTVWLIENLAYLNNIDNINDYRVTDGSITAKIGDVDLDGNITVFDNINIERYLTSYSSCITSEFQKELADVDKDGEISVLDATYLSSYLMGKYYNSSYLYNIDNMKKYSINDSINVNKNIYGYWLLSSNYVIYYNGNIREKSVNSDNFGVRPVITVSKDDLNN